MAPTGRYSIDDRLLRERVDEPRRDDPDLVDLALQEEIAGERGNRPRLGKRRRIAVGELATSCRPRARDELRGLAAGGDEDRRRRIELRREAEHVGVERAAQALVGGDQDHRAPPDRRAPRAADARSRGARTVALRWMRYSSRANGPRRDRRLLRLAHLRRRHHLHGLGDLRRAADRLDAPAKVAGAVHARKLLASTSA